jgi:predicted ArsR family transcriptional regulator
MWDMIEILQCLKKYGQRLDLKIAKEMGVPLSTVRHRLADLAATGEIVTCNLTRFGGGAEQRRHHSFAMLLKCSGKRLYCRSASRVHAGR